MTLHACVELEKNDSELSQSKTQKHKQKTLELTVTSAKKLEAETPRWALHSVCSGQSDDSNKNTNNLYKCKFPDSERAKSFQMSRRKLQYVVNNGLAPYFKEKLEDAILGSDCSSVSFDESLNDVPRKSEMDVIIRYWGNVDMEVKVRFWNASMLGHATNIDLLEHFKASISTLDSTKLIQVPSVNHLFLKKFCEQREENELSQLVDNGTCGLHMINGAFKTGAEKSSWELKKTLKSLWQIVHDEEKLL